MKIPRDISCNRAVFGEVWWVFLFSFPSSFRPSPSSPLPLLSSSICFFSLFPLLPALLLSSLVFLPLPLSQVLKPQIHFQQTPPHYTLQAQHAYAQRNIPPTTQTSPPSELQLLVKSAGKTIVDPLLALFADLSDGEDEESMAEGKEEREEALEREKIRELKRWKISWRGVG